MTAIVTVTTSQVLSRAEVVVTQSLELIAILTLIVFLMQKEVLRVRRGRHVQQSMQTCDLAIAPLLLAFAIIIVMRLLDLLR